MDPKFTDIELRSARRMPDGPETGNAKKVRNAKFAARLLVYVSEGGKCDLLDLSELPNVPLGTFPEFLIDAATGRREARDNYTRDEMVAEVNRTARAMMLTLPTYDEAVSTPATPEQLTAGESALADYKSLRNGQCYLTLFSVGNRVKALAALGEWPLASDVFDYMEINRSTWSGSFIQIQLGSKAGVDRQMKWVAHVREVTAAQSLLRPHDVFRSVAAHFRMGAADAAPPKTPTATSAPKTSDTDVSGVGHEVVAVAEPPKPILHPALGTIYDGTVRRFFPFMSMLSAKSGTRTFVSSPLDKSIITDFTSYFPCARLRSLAMHLIPTDYASHFTCVVHSAWIPKVEDAPTSLEAMGKKPTVTRRVMKPQFPSGAAPTTILECHFDYGNSSVVKPVPHFGGVPTLAVLYEMSRILHNDEKKLSDVRPIEDTAAVYDLYAEMVIDVAPFT